MALLETFVLLSFIIFLIFKWSISKFQVLKQRGVPHEKPTPLIGNIGINLMMGKGSFFKFLIDLHDKFKNERVYGFYSMHVPFIFLNDVELIKKICIKDSDNFINHGSTFQDDGGPLSKSLVALKDQKWKDMRNTLTSTFTGSKMRLMYELINECSIEAVNYLEAEINSNGKMELEFELKDFFTRFANDVVASAAFGIKVNSFKDKENDFYDVGTKITQFTGWTLFKSFLYEIMPKLLKYLGVSVFDSNKINYFRRLVLDAIKYREENNIIRPDMINLLLQARYQSEKSEADTKIQRMKLTDEDIVAQCLLFFFAGFETVSTCLCFTLYELMENPDVQDKLLEEILEMQQKLNGQPLHYDALMKMKYIDMVLSESLRLWTPVQMLDRLCAKDYNLLDDEGNLIVALKKDDIVWIPVIGQHRDSKNFESPLQFDPERFSPENKDHIKPFTYLPFGVGPRNCIANRFALMETKSIIYQFLLKFKIQATSRTPKDLLSSIEGHTMMPKEKFWIKIIKREESTS